MKYSVTVGYDRLKDMYYVYETNIPGLSAQAAGYYQLTGQVSELGRYLLPDSGSMINIEPAIVLCPQRKRHSKFF